MKRTRLFILITLILITVTSCKTQDPVKVRHVRNLETGHTLQGFYYALPRTVVSIDVTLIKTENIPGPFAPFASKYLGIEDVIRSSAIRYSIGDVKISSYAEPDPNEFYFVELDARRNTENPFSLFLSESGLISSVNTPFDHQEFMLSMPQEREYGYFGSESTFNHFIETNLRERIDTIIEQVRVDTVTVERRTLRRTMVEKSSEDRAKEVAEYIVKIRDKKFDLISGFAEITYSKETLEYMHNQLNQLENDYLELFTGITSKSKIQYRFYYLPDKERAENSAALFYFSPNEGILSEGRRGAEPVEIDVTRNQTTRQMGVFTMNPSRDKSIPRGIFYRIPEHGNISLKRGNTPLADARLLINQFGVITSLPADDMRIEFYPNTGSVKSVERIREN